MNQFGKIFKVNIYGESHNASVGVLVDGVPSGIKLSEDDFAHDIDKRRPCKVGQTARSEADLPIIESGLFNGYTTGTPMLIRFLNNNTISKDYSNLVSHPRPGHADFVMREKYHGFNDYRGGGHTSGRLTVGIVAAGVIAKKITNFKFETELVKIGTLTDMSKKEEYLNQIVENKDSVGGVVRITVKNVPIGLGEPYFYSLESAVSQILYSIGAVKGVSFGVGFDGCDLLGSVYNDPIVDVNGKTLTNNNGGVNGGVSNGNDIVINVFVKPTPSIYKEQQTYNFSTGKFESLEIKGRHDNAIVERAMIVLENAVSIALCDLFLLSKALN
jgi:chorismate synthase